MPVSQYLMYNPYDIIGMIKLKLLGLRLTWPTTQQMLLATCSQFLNNREYIAAPDLIKYCSCHRQSTKSNIMSSSDGEIS